MKRVSTARRLSPLYSSLNFLLRSHSISLCLSITSCIYESLFAFFVSCPFLPSFIAPSFTLHTSDSHSLSFKYIHIYSSIYPSNSYIYTYILTHSYTYVYTHTHTHTHTPITSLLHTLYHWLSVSRPVSLFASHYLFYCLLLHIYLLFFLHKLHLFSYIGSFFIPPQHYVRVRRR